MKTAQRFSIALILGLVGSIAAAEAGANPAWDKMKSLVGNWEGVEDGKTFQLTYKLVSSGTALMETLNGPDSMEMVTVYHPDGNGILMTHYCSMGNEPRMRATGLSDGKLVFRYLDAANLSSPDAPHMSGLTLTFTDANRLGADWSHKAGGKEEVGRFVFTRQK